ncbi:Uncharacterised protein [Niallia circulans]|uniref:HXXEE domain-containing protein n=1 Tax=Shouchella clausii TaxID=79880 RepID=UPI000DA00DF9|nr:HXXEE domain-containing protein [Shouchella clausii]SPT78459.1 Uncharacterised protein [Niallia circulans]
MIEALNQSVSIPSLIWLFLAFFMIHDFEEIIFVEGWAKKRYESVYQTIPSFYKPIFRIFNGITSSQFAFAVFIEFIIFIPVTYLAAEQQMFTWFLGFNVIAFLHVFTHVGQALLLRMYTPGVITAIIVILPYSLYLFYRLEMEYNIQINDLIASIPYGLTIIPIVAFGHLLAKTVVR